MKKIIALVLASILALSMVACSTTSPVEKAAEPAAEAAAPAAEETVAAAAAEAAEAVVEETTGGAIKPRVGDNFKVGLLFHNLDNVWNSEFTGLLKETCESNGVECTLLSCDSNAGKQIQQVEDLTAQGIDVIIINSVDVDALAPHLEAAVEQGVRIFSWDTVQECATLNYLLPLYDLGWSVGQAAAEWINEKYKDEPEVKVGQFTMSMYSWGVERGQGTYDAITTLCPNVKVVNQVDTETVSATITATEAMMTADPDIKAIVCLGDSQGLGSNQALVGLGYDDYENIGVFSADGTQEVVESLMSDNSFIKSTTGFLPPKQSADEVWGCLQMIFNGEGEEEPIYYYRDLHLINKSNGAGWLKGEVPPALELSK